MLVMGFGFDAIRTTVLDSVVRFLPVRNQLLTNRIAWSLHKSQNDFAALRQDHHQKHILKNLGLANCRSACGVLVRPCGAALP
jgi:hypothetical protein